MDQRTLSNNSYNFHNFRCIYCYVWIHVRIWKNEVSNASDYNITPISRVGGGRGLLVVFLTRESAALVQAQGPSLFIIKSCDSLLVTIPPMSNNFYMNQILATDKSYNHFVLKQQQRHARHWLDIHSGSGTRECALAEREKASVRADLFRKELISWKAQRLIKGKAMEREIAGKALGKFEF